MLSYVWWINTDSSWERNHPLTSSVFQTQWQYRLTGICYLNSLHFTKIINWNILYNYSLGHPNSVVKLFHTVLAEFSRLNIIFPAFFPNIRALKHNRRVVNAFSKENSLSHVFLRVFCLHIMFRFASPGFHTSVKKSPDEHFWFWV